MQSNGTYKYLNYCRQYIVAGQQNHHKLGLKSILYLNYKQREFMYKRIFVGHFYYIDPYYFQNGKLNNFADNALVRNNTIGSEN